MLTVGFNRRFALFYQTIRQQVQQASGPAVINCRANSPDISGDYWMADAAIGGAILGEACLLVDQMYWFPDSEIERVSAYLLPTDEKYPIGENNLTICTATAGGERLEGFALGMAAISENFTSVELKKTRS